MPKGISLHVGVNDVRAAFPGARLLVGCENDAIAMRDIAVQQGFSESTLLLGPDATYDRVIAKIEAAAADPELANGGMFLFTFAGHGKGEPDDLPPFGDELDHQDETLVLFDRMLFDDVLERDLWPRFAPGVRVLMVADSCHSGTVAFMADTLISVSETERLSLDGLTMSAATEVEVVESYEVVESFSSQSRVLSEAAKNAHFAVHREFYKRVLGALPREATIEARVLLLAACKDDEETPDGDPNGAFTKALLQVWNKGGFKGTYDDFIEGIRQSIASIGQPQITPSGQGQTFRGERPFTIG